MAKKEKNRDPTDPADDRKGDAWDHVADAESRLVVSVVPGEPAESVVAVVEDFHRRTGGRLKSDHHRWLSGLRGCEWILRDADGDGRFDADE